jgi:hypothetical protein
MEKIGFGKPGKRALKIRGATCGDGTFFHSDLGADPFQEMVKQLLEVEFPKIDADMHLLVVDNHSKDDTDKVVNEYSKKSSKVKLIQQQKNGLGWAYVSGFQ